MSELSLPKMKPEDDADDYKPPLTAAQLAARKRAEERRLKKEKQEALARKWLKNMFNCSEDYAGKLLARNDMEVV